MKRLVVGLLLALALAASVFGLAYGSGLSAMFAREREAAESGHYGVISLLPEEAPEFDPGENVWLQGDPRRTLIPMLGDSGYEQLKKHEAAYPIHARYMTLAVSDTYSRLPPPEGYYDYADRLVLAGTVQSAADGMLELTDCVFLGGRAEAMDETLSALLPEEPAESWQPGERETFSLRTWRENGEWTYRADTELSPGGSTAAETAISIAEDDLRGFDMVFTEEMDWILRVMQGKLSCVQGRFIGEADAGAMVCVASERFIQENGLKLGDSLRFRVGDKLCTQFAPIGALAYTVSQYPRRWTEETLEIIGTFADGDNGNWAADEFAYAYSENTVFVPLTCLPETVSRSGNRYSAAELTLLPSGGDSLERKLGWMQDIVSKFGLRCEMDDRGWEKLAAGLSGEEARIRARTRPLILTGAALFLLAAFCMLLPLRRKALVLRLAGVGKGRLLRRTLVPSAMLTALSACLGAAGAALLLRSRAVSLRAEWAVFGETEAGGLPIGPLLAAPVLVSVLLWGAMALTLLLLLRQKIRALAESIERKAMKK